MTANPDSLILFCLFVFGVGAPYTTLGQDKYCGIIGLFSIARLNGIDIQFEDLTTPEFVSSSQGSTALDLLNASKIIGLNARALSGLSEANFDNLPFPCLLHVSSDGQLFSQNHWLVVLGTSGTTVDILNSAGEFESRDKQRLFPAWNGVAIVYCTPENANEPPVGLLPSEFLEWRIRGLWVLGLLIGVVAITRSRRPLVLASVFGFASSAVALLFFQSETVATIPYVKHIMSNSSFETISPEELQDTLTRNNDSKVVLVDARDPRSFSLSKIPGSINIPHNSRNSDLLKQLRLIPKESEIIVFCQSRKCVFDRVMAIRLLAEGFESIRLLEGGWKEWDEYRRSVQ